MHNNLYAPKGTHTKTQNTKTHKIYKMHTYNYLGTHINIQYAHMFKYTNTHSNTNDLHGQKIQEESQYTSQGKT